MKQKKFGKKIQNWHRPPGRDQLLRRYARKRDDDPEFENHKASLFSDPEELQRLGIDQYWNIYDLDPYQKRFYWDDFFAWDPPYNITSMPGTGVADTPCKQTYIEVTEYLSELVSRFRIASIWQNQSSDLPAAVTSPEGALPPVERVHGEKYVMGYLQRLMMHDNVIEQIGTAIGADENIHVINDVAAENNSPKLAVVLFLLSPLWVRPPTTWKKGDVSSLIRHLFVIYQPPGYLFNWVLNRFLRGDHSVHTAYQFFVDDSYDRNECSKWFAWFFVLAQGGNLKRGGTYQSSYTPPCKAASTKQCTCAQDAFKFRGWNVNSSFQHHLFDIPHDTPPMVACMITEIKRLGGQEKDWQRIVRNPAFVTDPTVRIELMDGDHYSERLAVTETRFWEETVRWVISHGEEITDAQCQSILSWARHEYTEDHAFSWGGRNVQNSWARADEYQKSLEKRWEPYQWTGLNLDWTYQDGVNNWAIRELTSAEALVKESTAMHHCVSSYIHRCVDQKSSIFSLRKNNKRCLTIELETASIRIIQVRGIHNRAAKEDERLILENWYSEIAGR